MKELDSYPVKQIRDYFGITSSKRSSADHFPLSLNQDTGA